MNRIQLLAPLCLALLLFSACEKTDKGGQHGKEGHDHAKHEETLEEAPQVLTIYSGRKEEMMKPIFDKFTEETKIQLKVQYGKTEELAATLVEEGDKSNADIFYSQDSGTLSWLSSKGEFQKLPGSDLDRVPPEFRSKEGDWVGISGRARVLVYNKTELKEEDLPKSIDEMLDPKWADGKIGWSPENASFKGFVSMLVAERGEEGAKKWLEAMMKQNPVPYPSNTPLVTAAGAGEIKIGLTNHYYLYRLKAEFGQDFAAENFYFKNGKAESMINIAGAGIVKTAKNTDAAKKFIAFMLTPESQAYFSKQTHEFPVIASVKTADDLPKSNSLNAPTLDADSISHLETTDKLLHEVGALK